MRALKIYRAISLAAVLTLPLSASNVLWNPNFELGPGGSISESNPGYIPPSVAYGWPAWNNTATLTTVEMLPTTLPLPTAGSSMIHVQSAGDSNGLYQYFSYGTYYAGAWVYVLSGTVQVGLVGGGTAYSTLHNQWEFVALNASAFSNEIFIYTSGPTGADYYVDLAVVDTSPLVAESLVPEPASLGLLALGIAAIYTRYRP